MGGDSSVAFDINDHGMVTVVAAGTCQGFGLVQDPAGNVQRFGGGPGHTTNAVALNNQGLVVGNDTQYLGSAGTSDTPFRWDATNGYQVLATLTPGTPIGFATAVNDTGTIVGTSLTTKPTAVYWSPGGAIHALADLGDFSVALGINATGDIVGWSGVPGSQGYHALLWSGATHLLHDLGPGQACAINTAGEIVGNDSPTGGGVQHAVRWTGTARTATILPSANRAASAVSVNDAGTVVGWTTTPGTDTTRAASWTNLDAFSDLGTLGGAQSKANAINTAGVIVGAADDQTGTSRATRF